MDCRCVRQNTYAVPHCVGKQCDECPECTRAMVDDGVIATTLQFLQDPNSNIETVPLWLVYTLASLFLMVVLSTVSLLTQT